MNIRIPSQNIVTAEIAAPINKAVQAISEHIEFFSFRHEGWLQSGHPATTQQIIRAERLTKKMLAA